MFPQDGTVIMTEAIEYKSMPTSSLSGSQAAAEAAFRWKLRLYSGQVASPPQEDFDCMHMEVQLYFMKGFTRMLTWTFYLNHSLQLVVAAPSI